MGVFEKIKLAIFGEAHPTPASRYGSAQVHLPLSLEPSTLSIAPIPIPPAPPAVTPTPQPVPTQPIDIEPILDAAVKKSGEAFDWRHSIVDLMKALGMEASFQERRTLAKELGYTADPHDSADMNLFLHHALMRRLSDNGAKVPVDLLH
ncbi:DUF3597 domain-containing protein [Oryzifoliimicrobium ureilyticus]|uniref:DUF3597 domain-containing protein n=1 Tax=Oryzifoliimicrobium ureilyticus TaxID=3113724 RepID=UPI003075EFFF